MKAQVNGFSGTVYQAGNFALLSGIKEEMGFKSNKWGTFLQARKEGKKIVKGSKGVRICNGYSTKRVKTKEGKIKEVEQFNGYSYVFNFDQMEGTK